MFGVDADDFEPSLDNLNSMLHKRDVGRLIQAFQRAIIEQNDYDMEFRIVRPDGEVRYVHCQGRCEKDPEGEVIGLFGIMQDITERTLYEQELREAKEAAERAYAAKSAKGEFELIEYDPGEMKSDEIEIAVEHCGLCHSDLSLVDDEWGVSQFPLVAGHEIVGIVKEAGDRVTHLKPGDRVGVGWFSRSCLICDPCMEGDHNMCRTVEQTAVDRHGGFADRVRVQASWANIVPEGVDAKTAGPLFCGGITVFNPLVQFDIKPTDRVGVIGIGGLGHLALQFLRAWGCEVTAFTSTESKAEEARNLGAHRVVNSREKEALKAEKGRYDFILSTVAVPLEWHRYFAALAPRGRLHFVGAVPEPIEVDAVTIFSQQKQVSGTPLGSPATIRKMLEFCARHDIAPETETFPMSRIGEAFDRLREGKPRYRIVLENDFSK